MQQLTLRLDEKLYQYAASEKNSLPTNLKAMIGVKPLRLEHALNRRDVTSADRLQPISVVKIVDVFFGWRSFDVALFGLVLKTTDEENKKQDY